MGTNPLLDEGSLRTLDINMLVSEVRVGDPELASQFNMTSYQYNALGGSRTGPWRSQPVWASSPLYVAI